MAEIPHNSFQGPLAPRIGLNDNYRNPIPGGPKLPSSRRRDFSHLLPVGAVALALLILPLTIQQLSQQQDVRQQASEPTPTIVMPVGTTNETTPSPTPTISITPTVTLPEDIR